MSGVGGERSGEGGPRGDEVPAALRDELLRAFDDVLGRVRADAPALWPELQERLDAAQAASQAAAAAIGAPGAAADSFHGLVGDCPAMQKLYGLIEKFAKADAPVLITGESGTGKERVATALHAMSRRSQKAFVAENCAAIPATLLESVLFGHKKGAFTGAIKDHPGHFVSAHRGTLFLDEIGEMALPMQVKLLRVLQEGEVRAVGDSKVRKVDVRVIAATNQKLEERVRDRSFREDLYFRLNVLRLELPPLRDRGSDIVLLARRFLGEAAQKAGRELTLGAEAEAALLRARWPGNVRQLQNEMQRLSALAAGPVVTPAELSAELGAG
ncbi:MAG: sigma-54-dependent Fis family transcriptional regulator [Planctomycetes bacterium]|nr:sigma-54-dependent Fis family transcriptional regulator [Planctomycetota bacterium]